MIIKVLSKKTKGGLFVQFDVIEPSEEAMVGLIMEPPGEMYAKLLALEEEMTDSGEIIRSPDTGLLEKVEPMSDTSSAMGGYYEFRDEPASDSFIERLSAVFPDAKVDVEYQ
jgi:hypothetical protein